MVDVLDDSGLAQAGGLEAAFEALVLTLDRLAIDHHGETFLEGERGDIGLAALVFERLCHDGEPECDQAYGWDGSASFPPVLSGSSHGRGCCRAGSAGLPVAAPRGRPGRGHA